MQSIENVQKKMTDAEKQNPEAKQRSFGLDAKNFTLDKLVRDPQPPGKIQTQASTEFFVPNSNLFPNSFQTPSNGNNIYVQPTIIYPPQNLNQPSVSAGFGLPMMKPLGQQQFTAQPWPPSLGIQNPNQTLIGLCQPTILHPTPTPMTFAQPTITYPIMHP